MASFTANVPQSGQFPSTSQPIMEANNQYIAVFDARDHEFTANSTDPNCGTHKQVTLNNLGGSPGFSGASCVVYSAEVTPPAGDPFPQLFFDATSPSSPVQLTGHTPVKGASGFSYLPGGLMVIWGKSTVLLPSAYLDVLFPNDTNTSMPLVLSAPVYSVVTTIEGVGAFGFVSLELPSTTGFRLRVRGPNGAPSQAVVNWIAIGPA